MKTVLIIDDDKELTDAVRLEIQDAIEGVNCCVELDFSNAHKSIEKYRPDAIVLDLMEGEKSENLPGERTWKSVWEKTFCPIVIYTASEAELQPPVPENHKFVKRIRKGNDTRATLIEAIQGFAPAARSIRALRREVDAVIHKVLRDTVAEGHIPMDDNHLLHAGRRRIAASMDDKTINSARPMEGWEQYLIPAIGDSVLTADILRIRTANADDPLSFRLVLTPSCDLVNGRHVPPLPILVARCEGTSGLTKKLGLSSNQQSAIKAVISKALTNGAFNGLLPLPRFASVLPVMVANLKLLEIVDPEKIGGLDSTTHEYIRVASIDSPFREQVAWSYLTTAARPGMPDRQMETWAAELVQAAAVDSSGKK